MIRLTELKCRPMVRSSHAGKKVFTSLFESRNYAYELEKCP